MASISWCKGKKGGIQLIEPNDNLSKEYYESAEDTIKDLHLQESNIWRAAKKYYAEYHATYAILMKIGIKSEIHECTIAVIKFLEKEQLIPFQLSSILNEDEALRIDNQYYLKNRPVLFDRGEMAELLLKVKAFIDGLSEPRIQEIRKKIEKA
ncbi:MAG: hypothetical protein ABIH34_00400 [Nanoarchaeota archaeon]